MIYSALPGSCAVTKAPKSQLPAELALLVGSFE
jgi:hypothetical protein